MGNGKTKNRRAKCHEASRNSDVLQGNEGGHASLTNQANTMRDPSQLKGEEQGHDLRGFALTAPISQGSLEESVGDAVTRP